MDKNATLIEVRKQGEIIELLDGKRLYVNPSDITITCLWMPMDHLKITENKSDSLFSLVVHNLGRGEAIKARSKKIDKATKEQLISLVKKFSQ